MKTHDFFKQVTDRSMPDRESVLQEILRRPAPRRRSAVRYAAAVAAAAALAVAGWRLLPGPPTAAPGGAADPPAAVTPAEDGPSLGQTECPPEDLMADVRFNALDEGAADKALWNIDVDWQEEWSPAQVLDYLGVSPLPASLPADLRPAFDGASRWMYAQRPDGTEAWAQFDFTWQAHPGSEAYDPLERRLTVTVAKRPLFTCGILISSEEMEPSTIRGRTVYLGERQMGYGPYTVVEDGPNLPAGYADVLVAQFEFGGLCYDVTADNLGREEFVETVASLLTWDAGGRRAAGLPVPAGGA